MFCYAMLFGNLPPCVNGLGAKLGCVIVRVFFPLFSGSETKSWFHRKEADSILPVVFPFEVANPCFDGQCNFNDKKLFFFFAVLRKKKKNTKSVVYLARYRSKAAGRVPE